MESTYLFSSYSEEKPIYQILNKDEVIAEFKFTDSWPGFELLYSNESSASNSTINLIVEDPLEWLRHRKLPKNREFISDLLSIWNLDSDEMYVKVSHALSLNDTFWVKLRDECVTWADVNLYDNEFNETVANYALTGTGLQGIQFNITSPEFGTNGMLPKCWKHYDKDIYLVKGGSIGYSNSGLEPYSEYYDTQIARRMELYDFIPYDLIKYHGVLASKCKLFTSEQLGYRSFATQIQVDKVSSVNMMLRSLPRSVFDKLCQLIVFDAVICNTDRHLNNFGFLTNNETMQIQDLAPIFDNGLGFSPYWVGNDLEDLVTYSNQYGHCIFGKFLVDTKLYLNQTTRSQLRSLIGFKLEPHPSYNLPEERLELLNKLIQHQVTALLRL